MQNSFFNRGFQRKRPADTGHVLPPGQYETQDFPVLSAGPTPKIATARWEFGLDGLVETPQKWSWSEFNALPQQDLTVDIHCVTQWSKFGTKWQGVSLDTLLALAKPRPEARYLMAHCYGGYTTNLPLADVLNGKAFIGLQYDGQPLAPEHGGPARLVVPHLYFWKSAKWIQRLELLSEDAPGFWERAGYSMYGDPWKEQRYLDDDEDLANSAS
ncbi:DMSO/TMAO reductase YedYZ, molybdopterin-dependent catalytic subunit [Hymenobacter gelipurpurascens]|uniref:DMSO/TMAO reductase YedYZ, molybdopterin-dependent catalytic subunit n=1 Tax=Hymenobacter gelipurpurascens TaxID=89968 RepID=A0A212TFL9_9BACT|nr:sulfite oxidase-like oxidoreductase [Hymenobacter gelipurpurascens]SNC64634.1 DMSO/TMAO reductase YedYZ, molybdopterin-dependent catalytic subunit [Hymenobacter gelipurpurascens]